MALNVPPSTHKSPVPNPSESSSLISAFKGQFHCWGMKAQLHLPIRQSTAPLPLRKRVGIQGGGGSEERCLQFPNLSKSFVFWLGHS